MPIDMNEVRVWRLGRITRVFAGLLLGVMTIVAVAVFAYQASTPDGDLRPALAIAVPYGLLGFLVWRQIFHPRLSVDAEGLILRGPWRTTRVPWPAVVRCDPGYFGIAITCADGSWVMAPAPQKSNLSRWLGRGTRADDVADYLERRAREHRREAKQPAYRVGDDLAEDR
ncbi:PH domain-containing protein [Micromonospora sp. WMMD754]|uniref:PH domain-containing protein n=1 Tax=Micromonospora sp. WMMD754 TaxID=3404114 RepID=UPI003BF5EC9F